MVKKEDKIVVFGLGLIGKWFINEIGSEKVAYIIDNNKSLVGSIWMGIEVISLERYLEVANTLQVDYFFRIFFCRNHNLKLLIHFKL